MSQPIKCDVPGCGALADVMVSNLHNGDTQAMCSPHYNQFVLQYSEAILKASEEQEQEAAETKTPKGKKAKKESPKTDNTGEEAGKVGEETIEDAEEYPMGDDDDEDEPKEV